MLINMRKPHVPSLEVSKSGRLLEVIGENIRSNIRFHCLTFKVLIV